MVQIPPRPLWEAGTTNPVPPDQAADRRCALWTWVLLGVVGFNALGFALAAVRELTALRDLTHPEGVLVYNTLELVRGGALYRDFLTPPYIHTPYGPLLYLLSLPAVVLLGGDVAAGYLAGRTVVLLATGSTVLLVGLLAARLTGSRRAGVLAGLAFLTVPPLVPWGYSMRPDLLAIALSLAGLAAAWRTVHDRDLSWAQAALVAALLLAALWSKQTALAAPVALLLAWGTAGRWRSAVRFLLFFGGAGVLLVGAAHVWTQGAFYQNAVEGMRCGLRPRAPYHMALHLLRLGGPLLAAAVLGLRDWNRHWHLPVIYAGTGIALALLFALRGGSDINHLFEPLAAVALVAGGGFARALNEAAQGKHGISALALALLVLFAPGGARTVDELLGKAGDLDRARPALLRTLAREPGEILTFSTDLPLLSHRSPRLLDPMIFACLAGAGTWDPAPLADLLRRGEIPTVVLLTTAGGGIFANHHGIPVWPPSVLRSIEDRYRPVGDYGLQRVYEPLPVATRSDGGAAPGEAPPR